MGKRRVRELYDSCAVLGLNKTGSVFISSNKELLDGPMQSWSPQVVSKVLEEHINNHHVDYIVTFDIYGVSGHPNHCDTARGVIYLQSQTSFLSSQEIKVFYLESTNIFRKYIGVLDIVYTYYDKAFNNTGDGSCNVEYVVVSSCWNILITIKALTRHRSQLVWYRILFILFSRYTYVNSFSSIHHKKY